MWPNDYNGKITANFCEPRTHRFHAGIDVRTFGEIGIKFICNRIWNHSEN